MRGRDIVILEIGNTRSKAVFISNDEVREFYTDQGERTISSAVTITDAKADVGNKYLEERYPDHVVRRAFRLLNRYENSSEVQEEMRYSSVPICVNDQGHLIFYLEGLRKDYWTVDEVVIQIVTCLVSLCQKSLDAPISRCAVVVPDGYSESDQLYLKQLIEKKGIEVACMKCKSECIRYMLLEESGAFERDVSWQSGLVLLYSMGGCHFSASVIRVPDDSRVITMMEAPRLNGLYITNQIIQYISDKVQQRYECDLLSGVEGTPSWQKEYAKLARSVEEGLGCLHQLDEFYVSLPMTCKRAILRKWKREKKEVPEDFDTFEVSRSEIQRILKPLLTQTLRICEMCLEKAGICKEDLFRVIPVGACCYNTIIQNELISFFGESKVKTNCDMTMSSVKGLGYYVRDHLWSCLLETESKAIHELSIVAITFPPEPSSSCASVSQDPTHLTRLPSSRPRLLVFFDAPLPRLYPSSPPSFPSFPSFPSSPSSPLQASRQPSLARLPLSSRFLRNRLPLPQVFLQSSPPSSPREGLR